MKIKSTTKTGQGILSFLSHEFINKPQRANHSSRYVAYGNIKNVSQGDYISTHFGEDPDAKTNIDTFFYVRGQNAIDFVRKHVDWFRVAFDDSGTVGFYCKSKFVEALIDQGLTLVTSS